MDCIDCDFEKLDENNYCPQYEKTLCPYCEDHMYDANIVINIAVKYALVI